MTVHRFSVNIANPSAKKTVVNLRLQPAAPGVLKGLAKGYGKLRIVRAGIALDHCGDTTKEGVKFTLSPFASRQVEVVLESGPAPRPGVAAFDLIDQRNGKDVGGVTLACADPPLPDTSVQTIAATRPCPALLDRAPYFVAPGADPSRMPRASDLAGIAVLELVAPVRNPTRSTLKDVQVYLEHLGNSGAAFAPGTWNVGSLDPGQIVYPAWTVSLGLLGAPVRSASIVATSRGSELTRMTTVVTETGGRRG